MNFDTLYQELVKDFSLDGLPEDDKEEMLFEVSKTIQKQFYFDIYDLIGKDKFDALQASASMGLEFYSTTLKHLVPNYEEIFAGSKQKIIAAFNTP